MKMPVQLAAAWLVMARTYAPPTGTASPAHAGADSARRAVTVDSAPANDSHGSPADLAGALRRQLMLDNYDYLPTGSDEADRRGEPARRGGTNTLTDMFYRRGGPLPSHSSIQTNGNLTSRVNEPAASALPRGSGAGGGPSPLADADQHQQPHAVTKRVLGERGAPAPAPAPTHAAPDDASTKKYKMLKIEGGPGGRRRGGAYGGRGGGRRFLKEESADGIAIMKLDAGPLPEFRLPRARRQYMHYGGGLSAADEDSSRVLADAADAAPSRPAAAPRVPRPSTPAPAALWQRTLRPPRMQQVDEDLLYMSLDRMSGLAAGATHVDAAGATHADAAGATHVDAAGATHADAAGATHADAAGATHADAPENFYTDAPLSY